jgi:integrase
MSCMIAKKDRYTTGEHALNKKEYQKLISVVDHLEDEVMIKLAISTGIRREDLCHGTMKRKRVDKSTKKAVEYVVITGIKVSDIDFEEKKLSFLESKKNRIWEVPLSDDMLVLIRKLINSRGKNQSEYLITYSGRTAHRKLQTYCDKARIPRRPFHALRATCIKFCQAAGWAPEQVSKLTGDTIAVIQEHYSTPTNAEMQAVVMERPIL